MFLLKNKIPRNPAGIPVPCSGRDRRGKGSPFGVRAGVGDRFGIQGSGAGTPRPRSAPRPSLGSFGCVVSSVGMSIKTTNPMSSLIINFFHFHIHT